MAKSDDSPAISLFSFQDIITSLTGIMFLVVLLLILFMLEMKPKTEEAAAATEEPVSQEELQNLEKKIETFKDRKKELQSQLTEIQKLDLDHIQNKLINLRAETREQTLQVLQIRKENLQEKEKTEQEKQKITGLIVETETLTKENAELDRIIKEKEDLLKANQAQTKFVKSAIKYTIENSSGKSPVLVECAASGVRILDVATGVKTDLRQENGTYESRKKSFLNWMRKHAEADHYYTLLIKPESFEYGELANELKQIPTPAGTPVERGLEILPDDSLTIFGEDIK